MPLQDLPIKETPNEVLTRKGSEDEKESEPESEKEDNKSDSDETEAEREGKTVCYVQKSSFFIVGIRNFQKFCCGCKTARKVDLNVELCGTL